MLPGDTNALRTKSSVARRLPIELLREQTGSPPPGTVEAAFYEAITKEAFAEFVENYLGTWFKKREASK